MAVATASRPERTGVDNDLDLRRRTYRNTAGRKQSRCERTLQRLRRFHDTCPPGALRMQIVGVEVPVVSVEENGCSRDRRAPILRVAAIWMEQPAAVVIPDQRDLARRT